VSAAFPELLRDLLNGVLQLSPEQVAALEAHYELLLKWNRALSLTSVDDPARLVERHYCESLFVGSCLPSGELSIADIGSGPGFPGIPLAIFRPECRVVLIESHQRKAVFLKEATRKLPNVRVLAARAESVQESFDWLVSRAVSYEDLAPILEKLAPNSLLLTGDEKPPSKRINWVRSVKLPWGRNRFVRIGNRSAG
jgi:16S rRNA (guanine527-N7)-methyltransferase